MLADRRTTGAIVDSLDGAVPSLSLTLPNGPGAFGEVMRKLDADLGIYNLSNNSCVTFCGDILRAGGLDVPHGTRAILHWMKKQKASP